MIFSDEVQAALSARRPMVALESTLVAHGLPWPRNLEAALAAEAAVRESGAVPATIAILRGRVTVGVDGPSLERMARGGFAKVAQADLGPIVAAGGDGATTVSATAFLAIRAGITVFATGGIGGVHRGDAGDVSSDLTTLAREPVVVVSAGAKAVLDLPRTVEMLETLGVLVIGYRTSHFPAFFVRSSGIAIEHRIDEPTAIAAAVEARFALGDRRGVLVANPIDERDALDGDAVNSAIQAAVEEAVRAGIRGKALTPFLLKSVARTTSSASLAANRALLVANARLAAGIAGALARPA